MTDQELSPPFRDSDALRIIIRRLEIVEDQMRRREYGEAMDDALSEVADWLDWLTSKIATREKGSTS
ncbi:hypothetical protein [Gordonia sp. MMO-8]|uniref:hypothetical protein n=1 Tax=Gordonia sp. MMO-8 TaxID=3127886 RepID=UPI00301B2115